MGRLAHSRRSPRRRRRPERAPLHFPGARRFAAEKRYAHLAHPSLPRGPSPVCGRGHIHVLRHPRGALRLPRREDERVHEHAGGARARRPRGVRARWKALPLGLEAGADGRAAGGGKFQSAPRDWLVDETAHAGFACLGFALQFPQLYQYDYRASATDFTLTARGDLDGDGHTSTFKVTGKVTGGALVIAPNVEQIDPEE
jgi:hypothetical protein